MISFGFYLCQCQNWQWHGNVCHASRCLESGGPLGSPASPGYGTVHVPSLAKSWFPARQFLMQDLDRVWSPLKIRWHWLVSLKLISPLYIWRVWSGLNAPTVHNIPTVLPELWPSRAGGAPVVMLSQKELAISHWLSLMCSYLLNFSDPPINSRL